MPISGKSSKSEVDPNRIDEVVDQVIVISSLPVGPGQTKVALDEPIEIFKYRTIKLTDTLKRPDKDIQIAAKKLTELEVQKMLSAGQFFKGMVPKVDRHCRGCNAILSTDRHWSCKVCMPHIEGDDQYIYMGVSGD